VDAAKFAHVLGAMLLLATLVVAFGAFVQAKRSDSAFLSRLAFRSLLIGALPAWILMRIGAQWVYSEGNYDAAESEPGWLGIGFITSELGLLLLIAATVCAGLAVRRGDRPRLQRAAFILSVLMIVMYVVTIWAMTTKPE
jgi:hypothetical protein